MKQIFSILFFLNFTFSICLSQTSIDLKKELPTDPTITIGKLRNGLKYYIRENKKPENRAELRLAVNAGSVLEDDDQRGLAHFVEHMAFNGTKNFAKQEIVDYLESIGMQFGPDINAYTSFDETVYMLQVPTDSVEAVETAFQILEDWAHNISFEEEEIDKERGVVVEEWRLGRGAGARMRDKQFPILFKDSRYAERLPIGKKEILETAPYNSLRRFYRDWYRPDLMAIVAVGDFDKNWIEKLIKKHFRRLRVLKKPRERQVFPVPNHKETLFAPASDVEATGSNISIYYKHEVPEKGTVGDYRRSLIEALYNSILNNRLNELLQNPEPPFLFGFSSQGTFIRSKSFYILGAGVKDNGIEAGLEAVLTEAIRVRRHGFTESELERQKTEMLRRFEQVYNERDKTESEQFAAEYIRNFLEGESLPGIEYEYTLYNLLLPGIKTEEVNQLAKNLIRDENRVISVSTPEKEEIKTPTEEGILAVFDRVNRKEIKPYEDTVPDLPLVEIPPTPGKIVAQETIEKLGVTEWDLSNGVKVVLKPTDFKNDEILFTATSPGGHSLVPDKDFIAAASATAIIREGGLGNFDRIALQKKLAGKLAGVSPWISSLQEGLSGNASPKDLETLFELIYLHFTAPRKDNTAFLSFQNRMKGFIKNRHASPQAAYQDTIRVTMSNYHHRTRPWSEELLDEMNLETSFKIYQDRFADAGDFAFFFVGNFELEQMKPLVQKYLGGLPSANRKESWKNVGITTPGGVIEKDVKKGLEDQSRVTMIFTGPYDWNRRNNYEINSMAKAFQIKLREVLREDLGGTYGVGVSASTSRYPDEEYSINISWGCAPDRVDELIKTVFLQIDSLQTFGTTEKNLNKVKENQRRSRETDLKENRFWLSSLRFSYYHQKEPLQILEYDKLVEKLTLKAVQRTAQKYFNAKNYVKVVLYPEGF